MEDALRRHEEGRPQAPEGIGKGECPAEASCGRPDARQGDLEGNRGGNRPKGDRLRASAARRVMRRRESISRSRRGTEEENAKR